MDIIEVLKENISEIMDIDKNLISEDTYLVRDLNMESIDLLELSLFINSHFKIEVDDDKIFLKDLRFILKEMENKDVPPKTFLLSHYPHLSNERIEEILGDLKQGPVLKLKDVVQYIKYILRHNEQ